MKAVTRTVTEYEANDGTLHASEEQCLRQERWLGLQSIWIVYRKGQCLNSVSHNAEVFSTEELAKASLAYCPTDRQSEFVILEFKVDEYIRK